MNNKFKLQKRAKNLRPNILWSGCGARPNILGCGYAATPKIDGFGWAVTPNTFLKCFGSGLAITPNNAGSSCQARSGSF